MTEPVGPAIARQRIHHRLRQLREERGLPAQTVADAMRWSLSKLNRIENGKVTIEPIAVKVLLEFYGVHDPGEIDRLMDLSETSRERTWWRDRALSDEFKDFIAYENEASQLFAYQGSSIPGLLQTADYAAAITSVIFGGDMDDPEVAEVVAVRMKRQELLHLRLDGAHPPTLHHAIDEAVLLRPVGGDRIMAAQLDHLLAMAARPSVHLTVVPLSLPGHPGLGGNFELLEFAGDKDADVVFIESPTRDFLLKDRRSRQLSRGNMEKLLDAGRSGAEALRMIRKVRQALRP
jgi:transcriptional regulator with XRE-family HTH domain